MVNRRQAIKWLGLGVTSAIGFTPHAVQAARKRATTTQDPWAEYDAYLDKARQDWRVPGFGFAIIRDGATVYSKGFGVANVDTGQAVTADALFNIGSTSKAFTAAGVAMLVDQKRLDWDAPVRTYLPGFQLGQGDAYASTSLRDMLSHRTGLGRHDLLWYNNKDMTREGLLARLPYLETWAPLRAKYQYNNLMYMLAGHALERVAGTTWEEFTKSAIFSPLGMSRSSLSFDDMARDSNFCHGHRLRPDNSQYSIPLRPEDPIGPAGAVNSSVNEMAKWVAVQLAKGGSGSTRLFSAAQSTQMWEPLVPAGGVPSSPELTRGYYGLGWRIDTYRGMTRVAHGGNLNGFSARVTLFPEKNIGMVALTNLGASPLAGHASLDVLDKLLGLPPANWSARNLARRDASSATSSPEAGPAHILGTLPSRSLNAFTGRFNHKGYGDLFVTQTSEGLAASYNGMPMKLPHWHYDVFNAAPIRGEDSDLTDIKFAFVSDVNGVISGVSAKMDESTEPLVFIRA
jgi:CubicO group peptidase (beta-lactamase class C family)